MCKHTLILTLLSAALAHAQDSGIKAEDRGDFIQIETGTLQAKIRKKGYVSGIAQGSLIDRKTGAHDLGFGLHIMDFLLGPGWKEDGYPRVAKYHGDLPKHYIEGPQICTQAKLVAPTIIRAKDFLAVTMDHRFTQGHHGYRAGSRWEQTIVFLPGKRWVLCGEKITSANDVDTVFYRIDMPGHIKHNKGDTFSQVYLSYHGVIPAKEFNEDFAPDARFLYQRREGKIPERMIRAYQINVDGTPGPWLAGMTLDPALVSEAWCHQRGYVCFIEELFGKRIKAGETMSAAYIVGYFDDIREMERIYDEYKGVRQLSVAGARMVLERK